LIDIGRNGKKNLMATVIHFPFVGKAAITAWMIDVKCEKLIPILDVRKIFPVSRPSLRRWTASGALETVRMGTRVFTSLEALERMAKHGPQRPHQPPLPPTRQEKLQQEEARAASERLRIRFARFDKKSRSA
jgi:hypothetical protein